MELKKYLYAPENFSIEVKIFKESGMSFEECSLLNLDSGMREVVYLRAKVQNQMEFKVLQVRDIQNISGTEVNSLLLVLNNFQIY